MQRRSSKARDLDKLASPIVSDAIDERTNEQRAADAGKNPAAVALGRLGGRKGGKARAATLSARRRREIAQKAAEARWKNKRVPDG